MRNNKTLIFEGAGWEKADSSIKSGVGNCRIRTRIRNNNGRVIYLELGCTEVMKNDKRKIFQGYNFAGYVSHCYYSDSKWDSHRNYSSSLKGIERMYFEYSKENILEFVNETLNCSFDNMEVINDNSVRVHDTKEALCDCSNGDHEPYQDIEINISELDGIKPIQDLPKHRLAKYKVSYEFVKKLAKNWIESREQREQEKFPNFNYLIILRWDVNGIIIDAEITAKENFGYMGIGSESLQAAITEIKIVN